MFRKKPSKRKMTRYMDPENTSEEYWDGISQAFNLAGAQALWRAHSDRVNSRLLTDWLGDRDRAELLKTDLFDEAVSPGLFPCLQRHATHVHGIDISGDCVAAARRRYPDLQAMTADVRDLPYADDRFDCIVSNSTLDHFRERQDIDTALQQFWRVLKPGGELVITMDNLLNPVICLRNVLPFSLMEKLGLVPYFVGHTLTPGGLKRTLHEAGFQSVETRCILHCPRVLAIPVSEVVRKHCRTEGQQRFLSLLMKFERLANWPTAGISGHFAAALAIKP